MIQFINGITTVAAAATIIKGIIVVAAAATAVRMREGEDREGRGRGVSGSIRQHKNATDTQRRCTKSRLGNAADFLVSNTAVDAGGEEDLPGSPEVLVEGVGVPDSC